VETRHKYSSCKLPLLKRFSRSEDKGQGRNETTCILVKAYISMIQHRGSLVKVDLQ